MDIPSSRNVSPERILLAVSVVLGLACAWGSRYAMNPDGMAYLDLGDAYLRSDGAAANAYWSPMYAWLLGIAMRMFRPSVWWEFPVVHTVNFCIYLAALFSFRHFVRSILAGRRREEAGLDALGLFLLPEWILWVIGYGLFLWCSLDLITVSSVTPDLLLSAWIFLLGSLMVRLQRGGSYLAFLALGLILGAAYLTKSVMFPLGFVCLTNVLVSSKPSRPRVLGTLAAAMVFLAVCLPLAFTLSRAKGRLTFGDAGKLNYAWLVSPGYLNLNWQGGPADEVPLHPTRKIFEHPPVFEFAQPVGGTYPPSYDASYWSDGLRPRFDLEPQLRVLATSAGAYWELLAAQSGFLGGVLTFILMGRRPAIQGILSYWPLIAASLAALGLYSLIVVLPRFVGVFIVLLCVATMAGIRLPKSREFDFVSRCVALAMAVTMGLAVVQPLLKEIYHQRLAVARPQSSQEQIRAALGLQEMGLRRGDHVAIIGDGTAEFWARLARLKIVSQIVPQDGGGDEFWNSSAKRKNVVYGVLASTGARALITWNSSNENLGPGWLQVPGTFYRVYFLQR
jgi:hypothetical protein